MTESAQVDLWNIESAVTCGALLTVRWDGREACLSLDAPETCSTLSSSSGDSWSRRAGYPLCNGARVDCYPSGMARDMGGARSIYVLTIGQAGPRPWSACSSQPRPRRSRPSPIRTPFISDG